jgi:hypothetical protein
MAQMRAVVAERPDGPDGLVVREVPRPEPRPGWALVRVEAFGLNRSEYKTLKGYAGDAVTFPRILGIELVGVVEAVHGDAPAVPPGTTVAALMGDMGRAFDGGYAEYALVPEHQLIALDTTLPWDVLGALPETFVTAAGSLEHLGLEAGRRCCCAARRPRSASPAWSSPAPPACGDRDDAQRGEAPAADRARRAGIVLEGDGFAERARGRAARGRRRRRRRPHRRPAVLETLRLLRPGATACNSGSLSDTWVIPDFEPIAMIPSGRKLTAFHSNERARRAGRGTAAARRRRAGRARRGGAEHRRGLHARADDRRAPPDGGGRGTGKLVVLPR